jgi:DNA replication protein DnaC
MLGELVNQDSSAALKRAFRRYTSPAVLVIDELGYLGYVTHQPRREDSRGADVESPPWR